MQEVFSVDNFDGEDFGFTPYVIDVLKNKEKIVSKANKELIDSMTEIEKKIFKAVRKKLFEMNTSNGNLLFDEKNISLINEIEKVIIDSLTADLKVPLKSYVSNFETIKKLNFEVHGIVNELSDVELENLISPIQKEFVKKTIDSLTGSGVSVEFIEPIKKSLFNNLVSGSGIESVQDSLVDLILSDNKKYSGLFRHVQQVSIDAINQYDGVVNSAIQKEYELDALRYVGSIIETSRKQCKRWVNKGVLLVSELEKEILWAFKNGSGMINATKESFQITRGGHGCRHQTFPFLLTKSLRKKYFGK